MTFIPPDAKWYVADLIEEIRVPGRQRNHVWINTVLIRADSPNEAYEKSLAIGRRGNHSYKNVYGETVACKFHGVRELNVVYYPLKHGCELFFRSKLLSKKGIVRQITKKRDLAVFQTIPRMKGRKRQLRKNVAKELKTGSGKI